jgi:hypothetical protein
MYTFTIIAILPIYYSITIYIIILILTLLLSLAKKKRDDNTFQDLFLEHLLPLCARMSLPI